MSFTLPTLISERRDRSRFVESAKASPSATLPAASPLRLADSHQDAADAPPSSPSNETHGNLAEQLRKLECEEALFFAQKLLARCAAVEADARRAINEEWENVVEPAFMDAYLDVCAHIRRDIAYREHSCRDVLSAFANRVFQLLRDQHYLEVEEDSDRRSLSSSAFAAVAAAHMECPWRAIAPCLSLPVAVGAYAHQRNTVDADGTWPIVMPVDPLLAIQMISAEMLEVIPRDAVLQRSKFAQEAAREAIDRMIADESLRTRIAESHYSRERAVLADEEKQRAPAVTSFVPCCLPGVVLPWVFVEKERNGRLWIAQEWERDALLLDALLQLFQKVIHTEAAARLKHRSLYFWADEQRLRATLLLQRAWRFFRLQSAGTRRREAIRSHLPLALTQRLANETVAALRDHIEGVDDATLRDVWAEDCVTGELGLYYPYRLQVLEVTAEHHHRRLYRKFVQSLAVAVHSFVRSSHLGTAAGMRRLLFKDEIEGRDEIFKEQHRHFKAICVLEENFTRVMREVPDDVPATLPSIVEEYVALPPAWEAIYEDDRRAEWRRVALCANGWRQFRLEQHKLVFEMEENDAYIALVSLRGGSAGASARPPSSERIASAGYRRVPSAGYKQGRVVSSGGAQRGGSATFRRLGSASTTAPRRGSSADVSRVRLPQPPNARRGVPRFWEGYQVVIHAKERIALLEEVQRQSIDEQYARHVYHSSIVMSLLTHAPHQWRTDVPRTFASDACDVTLSETSNRSLILEDADVATQCLMETASALAMSAHLCRIVPPRVAAQDEQDARCALEAEELQHRQSVASFIKMCEVTYLSATEHLRRIGIIPRPASARIHSRLTSALQRDDLEHHRGNFTTAGRVATVIQRWWRRASSKRLHVINAAVVIIDQRIVEVQRNRSEIQSAHVVQQQLAALSDEQTLQRRTSSASMARQSRPPSSARASSAARRIGQQAVAPTRPPSAMSNLQGATQESMRTVLARRALQPQLFLNWAVVEQEESSSRAEWMLIEVIQRNHIGAAFASIMMTASTQPKLVRIDERLEPANRLRIEREALHSFVALFFCGPAEMIRMQSVLDHELRTREALLRKERASWHAISSRTAMLSDTVRVCHAVIASPSHVAPVVEPNSARAFVLSCTKRIGVQNHRRHVAGAPVVLQETPSHRLMCREDVHRTAVEQEFVALTRGAYAESLIRRRKYVEDEVFRANEETLLTSAAVFDDARTHCAEFRIADAYRVTLEQRQGRRSIELAAFDNCAVVLHQMHADFVGVLWNEEQRRWRHYYASLAQSTIRLLSEALELRLAHSASKISELVALEEHGRGVLLAAEAFRRESDEGVGESYAVVRASLRRHYYQ
jgi:hypothetical protein